MTANIKKCDGARKTDCTNRHGTGECEPDRRKTGPGVSDHDKYSPNGKPAAQLKPTESRPKQTRSQLARERRYRYTDTVEDEVKTPLDRVLGRLQNVRSCGDGHSARCPAHADGNNSLTVNTDESGKVLLCCHAGCSFEDVVKELGLEAADLFPPTSETQNATREVVSDHRPASNAANIGGDSAKQLTQFVPCDPKPVAAEGSSEDWAALVRRHREEAGDGVIEMLAEELGVSAAALRRLEIGWNEKGKCYTFPERNGRGEIVGVSCRFVDGNKRAIKGSKRGLTLPAGWNDGSGPVLIPEGASDTAAALTMGMAVVGRPSATGGLKDLVELLSGFPADRDIIVVGEMDAKADGSWPGRDAAVQTAEKLAAALNRPVDWCLPPDKAKDLREWLSLAKTLNDASELRTQFLASVTMNEVQDKRQRLQLIDSHTFATADYKQSWLVHGVLVAGQPAVVGGPKKTLKTSLLVDLAVSLGTGGKFLGEFDVERKKVGVISGESGQRTLQETYLRIRAARLGQFAEDPAHDDIRWGFQLPPLGEPDGLAALDAMIREYGLEVIVLDPLYLSLLSGRPDVQASNLFQMGPLLAEAARICLEAGATPIFVHHNVKQKDFNFEPPELEHLAFAGIQEFARQWLLVGRREKYEPGTGLHKLWLNVGGSAGFSGCWALDINEGVVDMDFRGRRWEVGVRSATDQRKADKRELLSAKEQAARQQLAADKAKIEAVLDERLTGESSNAIEVAARLSRKRTHAAIAALVEEGAVVRTEVQKDAGRSGTRPYSGYRLAEPNPNEDAECDEADRDEDLG